MDYWPYPEHLLPACLSLFFAESLSAHPSPATTSITETSTCKTLASTCRILSGSQISSTSPISTPSKENFCSVLLEKQMPCSWSTFCWKVLAAIEVLASRICLKVLLWILLLTTLPWVFLLPSSSYFFISSTPRSTTSQKSLSGWARSLTSW